MHLHFPIMVHYLTDKYEDRHHHLVIDIIYAVVTFVFVGANLGLGVWYWRYFTPADIDLRVFTTANVTSGEPMNVSVLYLNANRDLEDVTIDVFLPEGFVTGSDRTAQEVNYELGNVMRYADGTFDIVGVVFGNVGETYDAKVIAGYTSYNRRQYETAVRRFKVVDSSFDVQVDFPEAATYDFVTPWTIGYKNNGSVAMDDVSFDLDVPDDFTVESVTVNGATYSYAAGQPVAVGSVDAGEEGIVELTGTFHQPSEEVLFGDQQVQVSVRAHATVVNQQLQASVPVEHGVSHGVVRVIAPRVAATVTGDNVTAFGENVDTTVTLKNTSDNPVENILLRANTTSPATVNGARVNGEPATIEGADIVFPIIARLEPGAETAFTLSLPTDVSSEQSVTSQLHITGAGFSPDLQSTIPIASVSWDTTYESQITLSAEALYTGPNGEQLGYGPYPPEAWEVTALRVVLRLQNLNNPLSSVRVRTTLPGQVEWTGLNSVSAGTTLAWDPLTRAIDWTINSLDPQSQVYGAQFEVRFTPNHEQVGLSPQLTSDVTITAIDQFTATTLTTSAPGVESPVIVEQDEIHR